jgi:hypothetical protein
VKGMLNSVPELIFKALKAWDQFWFASVDKTNLALFRLLFAGVLFLVYLSRQWDVSLYYTDQGILPRDLSLKILSEAFRPSFSFFIWPESVSIITAVHAIFVLSLLLVCLGLFSRFFAWVAWFLHLGFLFRNYGVAFGVDQITSIWLFYLAWTASDQELSLRNWIKSRGQTFWSRSTVPSSLAWSDLMTTLGYRFLQIHLCVIYFYSGLEKLKGPTWWDGTALWSVFANSQMVIADMTWMKSLPLLIVFISFSTVLFEIYFPALVWFKKWRPFALALGAFFHMGIALTMALWAFALVMLSPYFLFLEKNFLKDKLKKWIQ